MEYSVILQQHTPIGNCKDRQSGSILVFALVVMFLLSFLGLTLLTVAATEHSVALNALWYDGALAAAEAGLNQALDQLSPDPVASTKAIPQAGNRIDVAGGLFGFRSGQRTATTPQPIAFLNENPAAGYNMGLGTGYNNGGYVFRNYQINATGLGPRNAIREVEARVSLGPISQ
jgi:hypothetical protein